MIDPLQNCQYVEGPYLFLLSRKLKAEVYEHREIRIKKRGNIFPHKTAMGSVKLLYGNFCPQFHSIEFQPRLDWHVAGQVRH